MKSARAAFMAMFKAVHRGRPGSEQAAKEAAKEEAELMKAAGATWRTLSASSKRNWELTAAAAIAANAGVRRDKRATKPNRRVANKKS